LPEAVGEEGEDEDEEEEAGGGEGSEEDNGGRELIVLRAGRAQDDVDEQEAAAVANLGTPCLEEAEEEEEAWRQKNRESMSGKKGRSRANERAGLTRLAVLQKASRATRYEDDEAICRGMRGG
jgi:hypothetical protein